MFMEKARKTYKNITDLLYGRRIVSKITYLNYFIYRKLLIPFVSVVDKKFFFIVGCYNSGTSLLNHLLGLHDEISSLATEGISLTSYLCGPESFGWNRMWHMCRDKLEIGRLEKKPSAELVKKEWGFWFDKSKRFWLEKSIVNSLNIDWFEENFRHPYFIWIVRNGYAVSEGIQRRTLGKGKHPERFKEGYPIELCAQEWVVSNEVIERKLSFVQNFVKVTYEDLTENPVGTLKLILEWLPVERKEVNIPGEFTFQKQTRKIQNLNQTSIQRLSPKQISCINDVIGQMLIHHGYELIEVDL